MHSSQRSDRTADATPVCRGPRSTNATVPYAVPDGESWPRVVVNAWTFGQLVELATTQIVLYGTTDPLVVRVLRRFANSLQMLDLSDADRAHVDAFAAKVDGAAAI